GKATDCKSVIPGSNPGAASISSGRGPGAREADRLSAPHTSVPSPTASAGGPLASQEFRVLGLDCAEEVLALRAALEPLEGVGELGFDLLSQRLTVRFDPQRIGVAALSAAIGRTGMRAVPWSSAGETAASAERRRD